MWKAQPRENQDPSILYRLMQEWQEYYHDYTIAFIAKCVKFCAVLANNSEVDTDKVAMKLFLLQLKQLGELNVSASRERLTSRILIGMSDLVLTERNLDAARKLLLKSLVLTSHKGLPVDRWISGLERDQLRTDRNHPYDLI